MDLEGWLRSLGLAPYEAAFRENASNEAILPKLTAEDLKDIGVTAVGHRRVLLDAIAVLRGEAPPSAVTEPANKPERIGGALPEAERRVLAECRLVLSEAKALQPTSEVHDSALTLAGVMIIQATRPVQVDAFGNDGLGSGMAQREPVARIEASLPMDGQECANSGLMQRSPAGKSLGQT
jgi:SAM domain (Sterile alpha motif)